MSTPNFKKSVAAGLLGTAIEWYDYGLFGFLAPVLAEVFFPSSNKWVSLLQAFGVFALGYFLRPIGGLIFGSLADRFGRVAALRSTILLISLPSLLIACLPSYASIGIWSQIALIFLRLLQGLSVGGEFAGSMVYLTELAPPRYRALFSGAANIASDLGVLVGIGLISLLSFVLPHENFIQYGWRIPLILGGLFGLLGYRLRKFFMESDAFTELQKQKRLLAQPLRVVLRDYKVKLVFGTLLCWMGAYATYSLTVYMSTYLNVVKHYSLESALGLQTLFTLFTLILMPVSSLLSNRFNKIGLLKFAVIGNLLYSLFAFYYLPENNLALAGWVLLPLLAFSAMEQGLMPSTLAELFPTAVRYSGVSLCYNLSFAYIGGAAPMYLTWLIDKFHDPYIPGYCMMLVSAVTGLALIRLYPKERLSSKPRLQALAA